MATLSERAAKKEQRDLANRKTLEEIKAKDKESDSQLIKDISTAQRVSANLLAYTITASDNANFLYTLLPRITGTALFRLQYRFFESNTRAILWLLSMILDALRSMIERLNKMEKIMLIMK